MSPAVERVLIAGAGIGGLGLAVGLGRRGIAVDAIEAREDEHVAGIGISVPNNALRMINELGLLQDVIDAGFVFDQYVMCDDAGEVIVALPTPPSSDDVPGYMGISRPVLSAILTGGAVGNGAQIRRGVTIAAVEQDGDGVDVTFSTGEQDRYDLVVGCEGLRSPLRRELFGEDCGPQFTGYACWRAKPTIPRAVSAMTKYAGATTKAGLVPINEDEMYLFHVTAEPGNPWFDQRDMRDLLAARLEEYTGVVADVREHLPEADEIVYSPLEEVRLPAPWYRDRVVVMGDAAHAVVPHLSQGGSQALEDAVVLADELGKSQSVAAALHSFMNRRFERASHLQEVSHHLLVKEMTKNGSAPPSREHLREGMSQEMASIRAYLDRPV
ncbi:MAG TPA: FAD-dependent monooxygenase [Gemmatimonadaceae bacterium]|nr:FAD-dependent monooxygenase [Gemmatimonadaceae bacterium]